MATLIHVLLVEDDEDDAFLTLRTLERGGFAVDSRRVDEPDAMRDALRAQRWDIVLSDWSMPRFSGLEALRVLRDSAMDTPFIIVSGTVRDDAAVDAMREGARDYLIKGRLERLCAAVSRELHERDGRRALRRAEQTLARTEKLRLLGQAAAGVSHDLCNVLAPIPLLISDTESRIDEGDMDNIRRNLADIRRSFDRTLEILDRLRYYGRPPEESARHAVEIDALVAEAVALAQPRAVERRRPRPVIELQLGAPPPFRGQPAEIVSALVNLLVNAIDALENGGHICVRTGHSDERVWVQIQDDGPGMTAEVQQRVTEPFFTTKGAFGTGLGLAMVRGCVEQHGGTMDLESAAGRGTTFTLSFPRAVDGPTAR